MTRTSVVIPVRNGARFVAQAVASVLDQLEPDDEVLVVDDGSTDGTRAVLAAPADSRLKLLESGGRGVSAARNRGLAEATGAFVAFLDHDDLWPAGRQEALLAALAARECAAAFGRIRIVAEADAPADDAAMAMDGLHVCELVGSALYRAETVRRVGGFTEGMHLREDADFHFRLIESGLVPRLVGAESLIYRRHGANVTNDRAAMTASLIDLARRRLARRRSGAAQ